MKVVLQKVSKSRPVLHKLPIEWLAWIQPAAVQITAHILHWKAAVSFFFFFWSHGLLTAAEHLTEKLLHLEQGSAVGMERTFQSDAV